MSIYRIKGASGAVINQSTKLGDRTLIGSSKQCDVVIDAPGNPVEMAEILRRDGGLLLRSLSSAQDVRVNGEIVEETSLGSGDEILVGTCRWVLQAPGLKPQRVLHGDAVKVKARVWPWAVAAVLIAAAGAAGWAWQRGLLVF